MVGLCRRLPKPDIRPVQAIFRAFSAATRRRYIERTRRAMIYHTLVAHSVDSAKEDEAEVAQRSHSQAAFGAIQVVAGISMKDNYRPGGRKTIAHARHRVNAVRSPSPPFSEQSTPFGRSFSY